ncbi:MAG: hypothetical protein MJZ18_10645 [Bacteroidales bacterium]|nr:hypothetical protein [Bacteroidales bacterium]
MIDELKFRTPNEIMDSDYSEEPALEYVVMVANHFIPDSVKAGHNNTDIFGILYNANHFDTGFMSKYENDKKLQASLSALSVDKAKFWYLLVFVKSIVDNMDHHEVSLEDYDKVKDIISNIEFIFSDGKKERTKPLEGKLTFTVQGKRPIEISDPCSLVMIGSVLEKHLNPWQLSFIHTEGQQKCERCYSFYKILKWFFSEHKKSHIPSRKKGATTNVATIITRLASIIGYMDETPDYKDEISGLVEKYKKLDNTGEYLWIP